MLTKVKLILGGVALLGSIGAMAWLYSLPDHYREQGRNEVFAKWAKQKLIADNELKRANEKVASTQKTLDRDIAELTKLSIEKENHDKKIIDNLKRDVADGNFRLRVTIKRHQTELANNSTIGHGEESGELLPRVTLDLLNLAGRANEEVHRTNKCIDQYNEVKKKFDSLISQ